MFVFLSLVASHVVLPKSQFHVSDSPKLIRLPIAGQLVPHAPVCEAKWIAWVNCTGSCNFKLKSGNPSIVAWEDIATPPELAPIGRLVALGVKSSIGKVSPVIVTVGKQDIEVLVASVATAQIKSTCKEVIVSERDLIFKFTATDDEGNQFATLHGGRVKWEFDRSVIQRFPLQTSPVNAAKYMYQEFEDVLVVRALEEGVTNLTATMECTGITQTIEVETFRPIVFDPPHYSILVNDRIDVKLFRGIQSLQNGKKIVRGKESLRVTSANLGSLIIKSDDSSIVDFSTDTFTAIGLKPGTVRIRVSHKRCLHDCNAALTVTVVNPTCTDCPRQYILLKDNLPDLPGGQYTFGTGGITVRRPNAVTGESCGALLGNLSFTWGSNWDKAGEHIVQVAVAPYDGLNISCPVRTIARPNVTNATNASSAVVRDVSLGVGSTIRLSANVPVGAPKLLPVASRSFSVSLSGTEISVTGLADGEGEFQLEDTVFPGWFFPVTVRVCSVSNVGIGLPATEAEVGGGGDLL
jgi:hypothetical protein